MRSVAVKENVLAVKPYVPGKPIEEVKRELGLKKVIKLASNECPWGPSPKVKKAVVREAARINRYPDGGCFYLRQALAKKLKVAPEQLIFGNGSDEIIVMAVKALVNEGDEVIAARPSFLIYELASQIAGAAVVPVPLKDFRYNLIAMREAITARTKIIFIGNPDNPAGTYVTQKEIEVFLKAVPPRVLVFFDEAYFEFVMAKDYPDTIALLKTHNNIIITRTFSKIYGLAGLRIGYGVGPKSFIDVLDRVREPFNVNSIAQAAALACLKDAAYYRRIARLLFEQKEFLYKQLEQLKVNFKKSAANFILIDAGKDGSGVAQALLKKGVIVRDMTFWGLNRFIRVTVGTPAENKLFLRALKEVL